MPAPRGELVGWRDLDGARTAGFAVGLRIRTQEGWRETVRYETVQGRLRVVRHRHGVAYTSWLRHQPAQDFEASLQRAAERLVREARRLQFTSQDAP